MVGHSSRGLAIGSLMLLSCAHAPSRVAVSPPPERLVYAALLDSLVRGTTSDTLLLKDSTTVFQMPGDRTVRSWRVQFDSIPSELPQLLAAISGVRRASASLDVPRPTRSVSCAELNKIFENGPGEGWQRFHESYPSQRQFIGLSSVAFSRDGESALVYYEYHCGGLCGGGNAVWLMHMPGGPWQIRKVLMFWVS